VVSGFPRKDGTTPVTTKAEYKQMAENRLRLMEIAEQKFYWICPCCKQKVYVGKEKWLHDPDCEWGKELYGNDD
jgi:hypothetical protein